MSFCSRKKKAAAEQCVKLQSLFLNARGDWDKIVNSYLQEGQGDAQ